MKKISLPKFKVNKVVSALSEVKDWGITQNNVPQTWSITQGEGINIYVLDTAGNTDHIDLKENFIGGINFSNSATASDRNGHGTHCAGIISAAKNNIGLIGVAPKSKIFLVKVLDDNGSGSSNAIERGLNFCYNKIGQKDGPDIISMSLGSEWPMGTRIHEIIKKIYSKNIPIVCAAGNTGREGINYPAKYEETIAIGAYDKNNKLANFSTRGRELDFSAPGVDIYSTWINNSYASISGTSMATPFIAGVIALLLSKHRKQEIETGKNDCKTVEEIRNHLIKHSIDKGKVGKDNEWGYGIIDVENMIKKHQEEQENTEENDKENNKKSIFKRIIEFIKNIFK
jgi:subtilisin